MSVFHSQMFKHPPTSFCLLKSKGDTELQNATLMLIHYHYNYFTVAEKIYVQTVT